MRFTGRHAHLSKPAASDRAGFTMVEIALSIAVVAFALVAIIGVLPSGLTVQRDNREDTIVNQDGAYLLEAIRTGFSFPHTNELASHVDFVSIRRGNANPFLYSNNLSGTEVIGWLSQPRYLGAPPVTNVVMAQMRAMAGVAAEKPPHYSIRSPELTFRYQVTSEIVPLLALPPVATTDLDTNRLRQLDSLRTNAYDVRLTLRWPVLARGEVGGRHRTFRTIISGQLTNGPAVARGPLFFFHESGYR